MTDKYISYMGVVINSIDDGGDNDSDDKSITVMVISEN